MTDKQIRIWKEAVVAYFKGLYPVFHPEDMRIIMKNVSDYNRQPHCDSNRVSNEYMTTILPLYQSAVFSPWSIVLLRTYSATQILSYSKRPSHAADISRHVSVRSGPVLNRILFRTNAIHTLQSSSPQPIAILCSKR
jgi:hypothetical protein